jgi:hypothetical protein
MKMSGFLEGCMLTHGGLARTASTTAKMISFRAATCAQSLWNW